MSGDGKFILNIVMVLIYNNMKLSISIIKNCHNKLDIKAINNKSKLPHINIYLLALKGCNISKR